MARERSQERLTPSTRATGKYIFCGPWEVTVGTHASWRTPSDYSSSRRKNLRPQPSVPQRQSRSPRMLRRERRERHGEGCARYSIISAAGRNKNSEQPSSVRFEKKGGVCYE